jgi:hypothetical protein
VSTDPLYAVITGDLVNFSKLSAGHRSQLRSVLKDAFEEIQSLAAGRAFEIYRGDSFQGVLTEPNEALRAVLMLRSMLRASRAGESDAAWDARMAVGIGTIEHLPENVTEGDGEAYRRSGPALDEMKGPEKLRIITPWDALNNELEASAALLDAVIAKWSVGQAEVVLELLREKSRQEIGKAFDISQAAVHYRVKGAGWFAVERFLDRYHSAVTAHTTA